MRHLKCVSEMVKKRVIFIFDCLHVCTDLLYAWNETLYIQSCTTTTTTTKHLFRVCGTEKPFGLIELSSVAKWKWHPHMHRICILTHSWLYTKNFSVNDAFWTAYHPHFICTNEFMWIIFNIQMLVFTISPLCF